MMRSLYSGVSGLRNHQTRMDVIGNNISNVNTIGFKRGRVVFSDMISQRLESASKPDEPRRGGINPQQVGLGMKVATIDTLFNQGSLQTTGVNSDVAIQGDGFFILGQGDQRLYTRAGNFGLDADGTLVNPGTGLKVQGWEAQPNPNGNPFILDNGEPTDINIPIGSKDPARATQNVFFSSNLNKLTPPIGPNATPAQIRQSTWTIDKFVYDSFGDRHQMQVNLTPVPGTPNSWQATVTVDPGAAVNTNATASVGAAGAVQGATNTFTLNFDNAGALASVTDPNGNTVNNGPLTVRMAYDVAGATPAAGGGQPRQTFSLNLGTVGSYQNSVTQFAHPSSTKAYKQDGYNMGYLQEYVVDKKGVISGIYTNGSVRPLAQIALAKFTNPGGLEKTGDTAFRQTINSGDAVVHGAGEAGEGTMQAGALEMSNVDLATEFTNMIVTERGFQANSRTITTSDTMLQELLNLKR